MGFMASLVDSVDSDFVSVLFKSVGTRVFPEEGFKILLTLLQGQISYLGSQMTKILIDLWQGRVGNSRRLAGCEQRS